MKSLLVGVVAAGALTVPATAAQAAPADCTVTKVGNGASGVCASGTGTYSTYAECRYPWDTYTVNGPVVGIGVTSYAGCPSGSSYLFGGIQVES
jgi:opacity protein-like surface antigen